MPRPNARHRTLLVLAILIAGLGACRDIAPEAGPSRNAAAIYADQAAFAFLARFGPTIPTDRYDEMRSSIARSALVPSRLFDDTLWTVRTGDRRELRYTGVMTRAGYRLGGRGQQRLDDPGDYQRRIVLSEVGEDQYRWFVRDQLDVGAMGIDEMHGVGTALLRSAEGVSGDALRRTLVVALPRTTSELGRLFRVDSLRTTRIAHGATRIDVDLTITPAGIEDEYSRYAAYLDRYVSPVRAAADVIGPGGSRWMTAVMDDRRFSLSLAIRDGSFAPLDGAKIDLPEHLTLTSDLHTRIGIFGIGASDLDSEIRLTGGETPSLGLHFRDEPEWDFPPLVEGFIRSSLSRPFQGDGIGFILHLAREGDETLVGRDYDVTVQESTIVRWIGGLTSTLTSDFREGADLEFDLYNGSILRGLRADLADLLD